MAPGRAGVTARAAPFWRDERVLAWLAQLAVAAIVLAVLGYGVRSMVADLQARGLAPGLGFLGNTAGFRIGEGLAFDGATDTYARAFGVGLVNTARVAVAGMVLATGLGLAIALGRLSGNPLVERLCLAYVEVFRNTPLVVQLIFWYQGVVLRLPPIGDSLAIGAAAAAGGVQALADGAAPRGAWVFLSQRGLALPALTADGIVLPSLSRFSYTGGTVVSPELAALLIGLVAYTAAFVAEVIRGGILAVPDGQREAARALGLHEAQLMRRVVLPQALPVIVPPMTNQYLNLVKNSSLAIYVGFPDLFNVSLTIGNNTGQFVVVTALIMAVYLGLSLITSLVMNVYNRRVQVVAR